MSTGTFWDHFYEIYEALPRQGPGDRESTERALRLLPPLTNGRRILDIGCGSGAQTIDLARATEAEIVAVDDHAPFVAQLVTRIGALGWWENYYVPLGECLARFRAVHAADPEALAVADRSQHEIDLYRRHPGAFGYVFFVMERDAQGNRPSTMWRTIGFKIDREVRHP